MPLRLMSYNIRFGGVGREERLAAVIRQADPDIVVLQEATRPDVVERHAGQGKLERRRRLRRRRRWRLRGWLRRRRWARAGAFAAGDPDECECDANAERDVSTCQSFRDHVGSNRLAGPNIPGWSSLARRRILPHRAERSRRKILRAHVEYTIEPRTELLPGNRGGELHDLGVVEVQRRALLEPVQKAQLRFIYADRRADVDSKQAPDAYRRLETSERFDRLRNASRAIEEELKPDDRVEDARIVRLDHHRFRDFSEHPLSEPVDQSRQKPGALPRDTFNPGHQVPSNRSTTPSRMPRNLTTSPPVSGEVRRCGGAGVG